MHPSYDTNYPYVLFRHILHNDPRNNTMTNYAWEQFNHYYMVFRDFVNKHPNLPNEVAMDALETHMVLQVYMHLFVAIFEHESRCVLMFDRFKKLEDLFHDYVTWEDPAQKTLTQGGIRIELNALRDLVFGMYEKPPEIPDYGPGRVITHSE